MATVFIPSQLRHLASGRETVGVEGQTLRQVIAALDEACPGIAQRLLDGDRIAPGLAIAIDGETNSRGLLAKVQGDSEIHILPALGGG